MLSEFQKTLEVAEDVEQNDEETRDGGELNDEETRGSDGGEHEPVGEINIVHEIEITSAHNDEEQTAPIITEEVMDAAAMHAHLFSYQGILDLLELGDTVLADRGFTIDEVVILHGAKLEVPAFTWGKKQLSQEEVAVKGPSSYPKFAFMLKDV